VTSLPGFNGTLPSMYSGYVTVDAAAGRALFYVLVEVLQKKFSPSFLKKSHMFDRPPTSIPRLLLSSSGIRAAPAAPDSEAFSPKTDLFVPLLTEDWRERPSRGQGEED
jgi:hypothetical protein